VAGSGANCDASYAGGVGKGEEVARRSRGRSCRSHRCRHRQTTATIQSDASERRALVWRIPPSHRDFFRGLTHRRERNVIRPDMPPDRNIVAECNRTFRQWMTFDDRQWTRYTNVTVGCRGSRSGQHGDGRVRHLSGRHTRTTRDPFDLPGWFLAGRAPQPRGALCGVAKRIYRS
jgi:hypothetical protein